MQSATKLVDDVLNNHFGTVEKSFEVRFFDNRIYQFSKSYHSERLAWAAGENWQMLSSNKTYKIV